MKRCFQSMVIAVTLIGFSTMSLQAGEVLDRVRQSGEVRCGITDANQAGLLLPVRIDTSFSDEKRRQNPPRF